jgi:hypothetical protein
LTTVVLVVLAVVWGLVLFSWLRSRSADGAFSDSVGTFRRHLRVLERTSPVMIQPANRMRSGYVAGRPPTVYGRRQPVAVRPAASGYARPALRPPTTASIRRRESQKRRRNVLLVLMAIVGVTMLAAAYSKSRDAVVVLVLAILVLCAYIALLVRMRNLAAEREMKLTYLPQVRHDAPARRAPVRMAHDRPVRRRPAGYKVAGGGYELAPGYRVAN